MQYFGCTGCSQAAADADPDNDGLSNAQEHLAGTDPTDKTSPFHVIDIAMAGNDVRVTWMGATGQTNVLQAAANLSGNYSNISPNIILGGTGVGVTNHLDAGALTNTPGRFYRVRQVP
jgi:hypothetical protein